MFTVKNKRRASNHIDNYENDYLTDRLNAQRVLSIISLLTPVSLLLLYLITPHASDFKPSPILIYISAIVIAQAFIRLMLNWKKPLNDRYQIISALADFLALSFILIGYAITYEVPLSIVLKSTTANLFFVFLTSRVILLNKSILLKTGLIAAVTWVSLVGLALIDPIYQGRTSSFIEYLTSFKVLIGAEIERVLQFGLITAILYAFLHSTRYDPPTGYLRRPFFLQSLSKLSATAKGSSFKASSLKNEVAIIEVRAKNIGETEKVFNLAFSLIPNLAVMSELGVMKIGRLSAQSVGLLIEYSKKSDNLSDILRRIDEELKSASLIKLGNKSPSMIVGGCALYPKLSAQEHLSYTDRAIKDAITGNKNSLVFDQDMLAKINHIQSIEQAIIYGLKENKFSVAYQPIIDMMTDKPIGLEALVRLCTEDGEYISPAEFIPIAENANLISEITDYLCDEVAREAVQICSLLKDIDAQPYININISPIQLFDIKRTVNALNRAQKGGLKINVEITESSSSNDERIYKTLDDLQMEGFSIAIDDFGTGYSSMQRLEKSKVSTLKVDQSFVSNIHDPDAYSFLNAIINLANTAANYTIVEGVETLEQKILLMKMGVRYCQGYYWARPMHIEALIEHFTKVYNIQKISEKRLEQKRAI